jgi:hypothetical protein
VPLLAVAAGWISLGAHSVRQVLLHVASVAGPCASVEPFAVHSLVQTCPAASFFMCEGCSEIRVP